MKSRKYTKKLRARQEGQTRKRIVEAAMALHEELGPRHTTISAIADRAGVQRLTVYRHFPDDTALFQVCSSQWLALNPPPQLAQWQSHGDAVQRTQAALEAFFRYYRKTEGMWSQVYRDAEEVPAMAAPLEKFHGYLDEARDDLSAQWDITSTAKKRLVKTTLSHCLKFSTWQSLDEEGLTDRQMANLAIKWLSGITASI